jgi:hypothetical protein
MHASEQPECEYLRTDKTEQVEKYLGTRYGTKLKRISTELVSKIIKRHFDTNYKSENITLARCIKARIKKNENTNYFKDAYNDKAIERMMDDLKRAKDKHNLARHYYYIKNLFPRKRKASTQQSTGHDQNEINHEHSDQSIPMLSKVEKKLHMDVKVGKPIHKNIGLGDYTKDHYKTKER